MKQVFENMLQQIVTDMGVSDVTPNVFLSDTAEHGEFSTNVAMVVAKRLGKNPMVIAEEIRVKSKEYEVKSIDRVEVVKPGFINFFLTTDAMIQQLNQECSDSGLTPKSGTRRKRTYIVEYSSPNIAKPFTVGHLRSTIIGDAIANLLEATGDTVYRDNHIGDWGTQFGKQIVAIKKWGDEEAIEKSKNPLKLLVALYVKFHEEVEKDSALEDEARLWFKKLEAGDPEARRLWGKCIDWSWKEFDRIYTELGIIFTENNGRGYGEAFFEDKMKAVVSELQQKNLLQEGKEGAKIVDFPEDTKLPPLMILKKDGATLYATRDLASDYFRLHTDRYGKEVIIINEVGMEQSLYFRQLYLLEEMLGWIKVGQRIHIKHGHYRFEEGKMSTRKGNTIWLEDVLEEAVERAENLSKQISPSSQPSPTRGEGVPSPLVAQGEDEGENSQNVVKQIAIGALKWNDLKRTPEQDITFDWDDILNMQGNSGPYLQYTYVRCESIKRKFPISNFQFPINDQMIQLLPEEHLLLRQLSFFALELESAAKNFAPHLVCTYLFELAQIFNQFYQQVPILKADTEEQQLLRLSLVEATAHILHKGLHMLGIQTPERM